MSSLKWRRFMFIQNIWNKLPWSIQNLNASHDGTYALDFCFQLKYSKSNIPELNSLSLGTTLSSNLQLGNS